MLTGLINGRLLLILPAAGLTLLASTVTVPMAEKNNSGISGIAELVAKGDSTVVSLTLKGGHPGTSLPSHIHFGTCQAPGGAVAPLGAVEVGPDSSGSSHATVATSVLESARRAHGSLLIQTHTADMQPAACGDVPAL